MRETPFYRPEGVKEFLVLGSGCFIEVVDQNTVLKYARTPNSQGEKASLEIEARIYEAIGADQCIIAFKGRQGDGILLEYAAGVSLGDYFLKNDQTIQQRVE